MRREPSPLPPPTDEQIAAAKESARHVAVQLRGHTQLEPLWRELPWGSPFYMGAPKLEGERARAFEATCKRCDRIVTIRQGEDGAMVLEGDALHEPCRKSR